MADRSVPVRWLVRWLLYPLQAVLIGSLYFLIRALPLRLGTAIGSFLFRNLGRRMPVARVAEQNVRRVFPELDDQAVDDLLERIWDNLGRGACEFASLDKLVDGKLGDRIEVVGVENLDIMKSSEAAGTIFSGHFGNWELGARFVGQSGLPVAQIYRGADNPYIDRLFKRARHGTDITLVPKGREGAATMLRLMRQGMHFGAMMDQKLNEGVAVPFFGSDAMTATAPVELALRMGGPIVPVRCVRLPNAHFRIEFQPPLAFERTGDRKADAMTALKLINGILEDWVRENPEQWFWLHRRWPKV